MGAERSIVATVAIVVMTVAFSRHACAAPPVGQRAIAQVDRIAEDWVRSGHTPGLAVGIMQNSKIIFAEGYGLAQIENAVPVRSDSVFRVGSVQKQFTAVALLKLVEEGRASLDEKLSKYYPEFYRSDEVTLRQLLNHTSGISSFTDSADVRQEFRGDMTTRQMVEMIKHLYPPYQFSPGTAWHYNNSAYYLAGAVVEKISGESLNDYLHERILEPLGLADTAMDIGDAIVPNRVTGYVLVEGEFGEYQRARFLSMTVPGGAGALRSTVSDLLKWQAALFDGRIVSKWMLTEMLAPARLNNGQLASGAHTPPPQDSALVRDNGLGVYVSSVAGHKRVNHGGSINGFNAILSSYPDDNIAWVALSNAGGGVSGLEIQIEAVLLGLDERSKNAQE